MQFRTHLSPAREDVEKAKNTDITMSVDRACRFGLPLSDELVKQKRAERFFMLPSSLLNILHLHRKSVRLAWGSYALHMVLC